MRCPNPAGLRDAPPDGLAAALWQAWREAPPPLARSSGPLERAAPVLLVKGGAGLLWRRLTPSGAAPEGEIAGELRNAYRVETLQARIHQQGIEEAFTRLREGGVEPLLVKGWAAARLYPEPGLRPYCDIDLCVDPDHLARAEAVLDRWTDRRYRIELHPGYPKVYDRSWAELLGRSEQVQLGGTLVRVAGAEDHLRLLCLHMLAHGAWRPVWLCDVAAAIERRPAGFDWDCLLAGDQRYSEWVVACLGLAQVLLGASLLDVPVAERAFRLPRWFASAVLEQWETLQAPTGQAWLLPQLRHGLRRPGQLLRELRSRWRDPVQATVELRAPLNDLPRWPLQLSATIARALPAARTVARARRAGSGSGSRATRAE